MSSPFDGTTEFGQRVQQRLREESVIWLTTVNQRGQPQPTLVWFLWEGETVLIFSQPNKSKVRAISANPNVALNFDADGNGGNMIVLNGTATLADHLSVDQLPAGYFEKYERGLQEIGFTPEAFIETYSQPIRITIDRIRGH
jgi:PPOX class probable F420-dependent enzyme